ncbi:helix-turn-helix domain-containing protein [Mucilaginibacter lappiensis]|uniref:helix-turn-helix domain-containing protein n=1 Tax=Mucilaginibacter lappiensis TaxID=354630 RepID=UPI003D1F680D
MSLSVKDHIIPQYSFQEMFPTGNSMFELVEAKGQFSRHKSMFLTPHRRNYYQLALVNEGNSRHWVDATLYNLSPDSFYFSTPQQVHIKEQAKPFLGINICFTQDFLDLENNPLLKNLPIITNPHNGHELKLQAADRDFITQIINLMLKEKHQHQNWKNAALHAYLHNLLIYLSRLYEQQFAAIEQNNDHLLLRKFTELINDHYLRLHEVAAYARLLHISAGHLTAVVKAQSGKTPIRHIHERLVVEAKRLLFHTELSIKEITYELGFEDDAYFNRFFKRFEKSTPTAYRQAIREIYR